MIVETGFLQSGLTKAGSEKPSFWHTMAPGL